MEDTKNPYFLAVEARTEREAERCFQDLLREAIEGSPSLNPNHDRIRERVVANLCYVAGYFDEETRKRVGRLYGHRSPYRSHTPTQ